MGAEIKTLPRGPGRTRQGWGWNGVGRSVRVGHCLDVGIGETKEAGSEQQAGTAHRLAESLHHEMRKRHFLKDRRNPSSRRIFFTGNNSRVPHLSARVRTRLQRSTTQSSSMGPEACSQFLQQRPPNKLVKPLTLGVASRPAEVGVLQHEGSLVVGLQLVHLLLEQLLRFSFGWFLGVRPVI